MILTVLPETFDLLRKEFKVEETGKEGSEIDQILNEHKFKVAQRKSYLISALDKARNLEDL